MTAKTVTDADRSFWSFRPLSKQAVPEITDDQWCRTPVDRFVLDGLVAKGLTPNGRQTAAN